jgi:ribosomal protein S18 acetylase RimI-like enzyme
VLIREVEPAADGDLAHALLLIQHAAYTVEAALLDDDRIPPLHEHVDELRKAPLRWLGAFVEDRLLGALAWSRNNDEFDIDRLMVAPSAHRRGVGTALVLEALHRTGDRRAIVSTGRDNLPARALYERLGFLRIADEEIVPGLWVTNYAHLGTIGPDPMR